MLRQRVPRYASPPWRLGTEADLGAQICTKQPQFGNIGVIGRCA